MKALMGKAFEEWDKYNKVNFAQILCGEISVKNERRKGWRAALKWVQTLPSSGSSEYREPMRYIREELENK